MAMKLSMTTHDLQITIHTTQSISQKTYEHTHTHTHTHCSLRAHIFRHQQPCIVITSWPSKRLTLQAPTKKACAYFQTQQFACTIAAYPFSTAAQSIASNKTDTHMHTHAWSFRAHSINHQVRSVSFRDVSAIEATKDITDFQQQAYACFQTQVVACLDSRRAKTK